MKWKEPRIGELVLSSEGKGPKLQVCYQDCLSLSLYVLPDPARQTMFLESSIACLPMTLPRFAVKNGLDGDRDATTIGCFQIKVGLKLR